MTTATAEAPAEQVQEPKPKNATTFWQGLPDKSTREALEERTLVERRRRRTTHGCVTAIYMEPKTDELGPGFTVECEHGTVHPERFGSFGKALDAAKGHGGEPWCEQCAAAKTAKATKAEGDGDEEEASSEAEKPKRQRRQRASGKANGPRTSNGKEHPVTTRHARARYGSSGSYRLENNPPDVAH
jgi:hypothetical protein